MEQWAALQKDALGGDLAALELSTWIVKRMDTDDRRAGFLREQILKLKATGKVSWHTLSQSLKSEDCAPQASLLVAGVDIFHVMSSLGEAQPEESQKSKATLYMLAREWRAREQCFEAETASPSSTSSDTEEDALRRAAADAAAKGHTCLAKAGSDSGLLPAVSQYAMLCVLNSVSAWFCLVLGRLRQRNQHLRTQKTMAFVSLLPKGKCP